MRALIYLKDNHVNGLLIADALSARMKVYVLILVSSIVVPYVLSPFLFICTVLPCMGSCYDPRIYTACGLNDQL